tara:strand:+ start:1760 stop:1870 length:111 start_codon:yes stop_codon:yes gene_type:complete
MIEYVVSDTADQLIENSLVLKDSLSLQLLQVAALQR